MENFSGEKDKSKESADQKKVKKLFNKLVVLVNFFNNKTPTNIAT